MLRDNKGQGLTEYVIGLSAVLVLASIVMAIFGRIGNAWTRQGARIDAIP